jgi:hypothetical protein
MEEWEIDFIVEHCGLGHIDEDVIADSLNNTDELVIAIVKSLVDKLNGELQANRGFF